MERSAAYKWAGHVVPGSWPDWEDHMAHAGVDGWADGWMGGWVSESVNADAVVCALWFLLSSFFIGQNENIYLG